MMSTSDIAVTVPVDACAGAEGIRIDLDEVCRYFAVATPRSKRSIR
jgi:hypothetical protein